MLHRERLLLPGVSDKPSPGFDITRTLQPVHLCTSHQPYRLYDNARCLHSKQALPCLPSKLQFTSSPPKLKLDAGNATPRYASLLRGKRSATRLRNQKPAEEYCLSRAI